jgi:hypothetical protein
MAVNGTLNYGRFMERAMRGVMAQVLGHVAHHGLTGSHYFYITFETGHPGVDIPAWLHERYPEEMMIVLQEWFEDLAVMGDRFRVTLNFSDRPETLVIPFDAVKTFIDPSAKFGLKFDDQDSDEMLVDLDRIEEEFENDTENGAGDGDDGGDGDGHSPSPRGGGPRGSADVVSLDRFRKG